MEQTYAKWLNKAVRRCGRAHDRDEVMALFTQGLDPVTSNLLQAYRADQDKETYMELIQQARCKEDAVRARNTESSVKPMPRVVKPSTMRRQLHLIQSFSKTSSKHSRKSEVPRQEELHIVSYRKWAEPTRHLVPRRALKAALRFPSRNEANVI